MKDSKSKIKTITMGVITLLIALAMYLSVAFVVAEANPMCWSIYERFWSLFLWVALAIFVCHGVYGDNFNKKK